jgi:hypothetical protein
MYNQGLRICNTQTTHLPINIMTLLNIANKVIGCDTIGGAPVYGVTAQWFVDQFMEVILPLTESGQLNTMSNYKTFSFTVVGIVTTMAIVCHLGVQALDKATAQQCRTHAWPQAAHQIHMDWCADNGYATN